MKQFFLLGLVLVTLIFCTACPETPQISNEETPDEITEITFLLPPFRYDDGGSDWYLTQSFGADYKNDELNIDGKHYGEDWSRGAGDTDINEDVYPIAPGVVIDSGDYGEYGGYIIVKHTGSFIIPESDGPHILSSTEVTNDPGCGSKGEGEGIINSQDVYCTGNMIYNDFFNEEDYYYESGVYNTIYSLYLHVKPLVDEAYDINENNINEPIAQLMDIPCGMPAHLHFEIRVEDPANYTLFPNYFEHSQDMINIGYREPSSIIQANLQEGAVLGQSIESIAITQDDGTQGSDLPDGSYMASLKEYDENYTKKLIGVTEVAEGYMVSMTLFEPAILSIDDFNKLNNGEIIDTAIGRLQLNDWSDEECNLICLDDNECIMVIDDDGFSDESGDGMIYRLYSPEYSPLLVDLGKYELFIADNVRVINEVLGDSDFEYYEISFKDYIENLDNLEQFFQGVSANSAQVINIEVFGGEVTDILDPYEP